MKRGMTLIGAILLFAGLQVHAHNCAEWHSDTDGDWHDAANWADVADALLPVPGYPTEHYRLSIGDGYVTISAQDVNIPLVGHGVNSRV
jgi:hypothetical protein